MSKALSASLEVPVSAGTYSAALEGLTGVDEILMRRTPTPPLYATGARWQVREGDPSEMRWRYPHDVITSGWGDCQDLSAYRAAELRVSGEDPSARVRVYPTGMGPDGQITKFHAVVERGNGAVEDPSVVLGMSPIPGAPMTTSQLPDVSGLGLTPPLGVDGVGDWLHSAGQFILDHPIASLLVAPEAYAATRMLMAPPQLTPTPPPPSGGWSMSWDATPIVGAAPAPGIKRMLQGTTNPNAVPRGTYAGQLTPMSGRVPSANYHGTLPMPGAVNPNNTPGMPGYNPALPANTPTGIAATNPLNPYNVPGLPGYNPYQQTNPASGYNAQNPYNAPGLPGYNPYLPSAPQGTPIGFDGYGGYGSGYGEFGPTAADLGLPSGGDPAGAFSPPPLDLSAYSDPADQNALASYYDPMSQLGPWSY